MTRTILGIALLTLMAAQVQAASITVFTGPDYRGEQQTFDRASPRLADVGWNDRIASVQVRGGEWQLCRAEKFTECIRISRDAPNLANWGMDYAVNSLRPVRGDERPLSSGAPSITVFEGSGFRGQRQSFRGSIPRLRNQGWDNRVGSVTVGAGEWDLCANEEFRDCVTISEDQADLTSQRLDYRVRSLRPVVPVEIEPPPPTGLPDRMTQAQSQYVAEHLYRAVLGREPDAEGLANATSEIRFGNLEKLTNSLLYSNEGRALRLSPEERLEQIYQGLLGRSPREGAQAHLSRLQQGRSADVILTVLNSEEFVRSLPK